MDNLGSHRGKIVTPAHPLGRGQAAPAAKYSPNLNPIEQVFAKLKHLLAQSRRANCRNRLRRYRRASWGIHR
ncbi:MAG: hypothetical protein K2Z80_11350 [Xanthobacteraceae bacterium]|nr:hypothetical protein [Xanthobacteraceae bacterium]